MNHLSNPHRASLAAWLSAALSLGTVADDLQAQTDRPTAGKPAAGKVAEWPPLKDTDKDRVLNLVGQFRKPDPKLQADAKQSLLKIGAGAAPLLFGKVVERDDGTNEPVFAVLDVLLDKSHAALMAREAQKPRVELRRYLVRRLCRFHDADLVPLFKSLAADKDEPTAFYANLALLAHKERDAVAPVMTYTKAHWAEEATLVAEALTPARSMDCANLVFEAIAKAGAADQMTGLRLLRFLMVKEQGVILRTYLEAAEHSVKREAVNTARVLHGEPAIDNLSVFQAIEHAKNWLKKI